MKSEAELLAQFNATAFATGVWSELGQTFTHGLLLPAFARQARSGVAV
jgi:hypothetical protein